MSRSADSDRIILGLSGDNTALVSRRSRGVHAVSFVGIHESLDTDGCFWPDSVIDRREPTDRNRCKAASPDFLVLRLKNDVVLGPQQWRQVGVAQKFAHLDFDHSGDLRNRHIVGTALERVLGAFTHLLQRGVHP